VVTTQPKAEDYGLTRREGEVLKNVFLKRPREQRQRALDFVNDSDPNLERNKESE